MNYLRQDAAFSVSSYYHNTDAFPSLQITAHPNNTRWIIKICSSCMHKIEGRSGGGQSPSVERCKHTRKQSEKYSFGCFPPPLLILMVFWNGQRFYIWPENPWLHEAHLRGNEAKGAKPRDGPHIHVWITLIRQRQPQGEQSCFSILF